MLRVNAKHNSNEKSLPFKGALLSSGVMAFAGLGDAFLYPVLPIYGENMGFSIFFIGLLLSVNRFVRILLNTQIANLVHKIGMKKVLIISSSLAVISTLVYGLKAGLIVFFMARVLWGLCYSGLKIATLNYAALVPKKSGLAFGLVQSIKSLGALSVLWFGPVFVQKFGVETGIFLIALISTIGVILAAYLPSYKEETPSEKVQTKKTFTPSAMNLLVFMLSSSIDGILVVTLSKLLASSYPGPTELLAIVAFYLLMKRLFVVGLSMVSGILTLRISTHKIYYVSVAICILGLFLIALNATIVGVILAFLCNTVVVTFSPLMAIDRQPEKNNSLQAISGVSTWWDLGAAIGAFAGIYLVDLLGVQTLFLALSSITLVLFINFIKQYGITGNSNSRAI